MKNLSWIARKFLVLAHLFVGLAAYTTAAGQQAIYKPLLFTGEPSTLTTNFNLPVGCYRGAGPLTISPEKGERCTLEIAPTSILESTKIILREGAQLRVRGALLRDCHIFAQPGSEVILESTGLERCELGGDTSKTKSPTSFRATNCYFLGGAWLSPANRIGLEMMDCVVRDQLANAYVVRVTVNGEFTPVSFARRPAVRFTRFENCFIHPTLLLNVSQVTMDGCKSVIGSTAPLFAAGAGAAPEVVLPIRWVNCEPESPPVVGGGVALQRLTDPIAGGSTLVAKAEGGRLIVEGVTSSTPLPLKSSLPEATASRGPSKTPKTDPSMTIGTLPDTLKAKQAHVNGLLVMPLESGLEAGMVSKMNITAIPGGGTLRFTQYVGEDMATALREVQKFVRLRHQTMPLGTDLEIAFEEKYSEKDGPSAAVACTLLVEAIMTGKVWDATFAVTGDMNADGAVQPVGGVAAKVRGATKASCKIVAVPARNESAISDILVLDGPGPLVGINVFGLEKFDQAVALASATGRPPALQQAVDEFEIIRNVIQRDPRQTLAILRSGQAVARLQAIVEKAPHSLSAKYLLMFAQGRSPATLSLGGSLEAADASALGLVRSITTDFKGAVSSLKQDELGGTLNRLRNLRPKTDPRVWPYLDSLVDYGDLVRTEVLNPSRTYGKFSELAAKARQAASVVQSAKKGLLADPQVREDLGL